MHVVCVDDEPNALEAIERELRKIAEVADIKTFLSPAQALEYITRQETDVAILDIDMPTMGGLSLAKKIREQSPRTNIIFLTGYSHYAVDAFRLHVSGYLLKPALQEDIEKEFSYLKKTAAVPAHTHRRVRVQCIGNFEVFVDGAPLKFERSKTKELFAYLVDRKGAASNTGELCAVLWEDKPDSVSLRNQLRTLLSDLSRSLKSVQAEDILIKNRNHFAVATDKMDCDFYSFLQKEAAAVNHYTGEYMTQYSWAEMTLGLLER